MDIAMKARIIAAKTADKSQLGACLAVETVAPGTHKIGGVVPEILNADLHIRWGLARHYSLETAPAAPAAVPSPPAGGSAFALSRHGRVFGAVVRQLADSHLYQKHQALPARSLSESNAAPAL